MSAERGFTSLGDGTKTAKSDARLTATAACEDASADLGLTLSLGGDLPEDMIQLLGGVQNDLFDVCADLHTPVANTEPADQVRIDQGYIDRVDYLTRYYSEPLIELPTRAIPGGTAVAALLHKAHTAVRVAEVNAWKVVDAHGPQANRLAAEYLDALAHLVFALARASNAEHGDTIWRPGLSASHAEEAAAATETTEATEATEPAGT